jgi:sugar phosphate isomerase/epimerase
VKLGCNTVGFRHLELGDALERVARAGFPYVEVESNLSWCHHVDTWNDDPGTFRAAATAAGFDGVSGLGSHRELITDPQAVADLQQAIRWAAAASVPVVITGEGRCPPLMDEDEALRVIGDRLRAIVPVAEEFRVVLAIEPHGTISLSPNGLARIMALVPSPWLAVNFDTANPHRGDYVGTTRDGYEWKLDQSRQGSEVELLETVAPLVRHVHAKDVVGRRAVALGRGEVDLPQCLKVLMAHGFDGVLSYETEGEDTPEKTELMMAESRRYLERTLVEIGAATTK